ncbi:MAG: helix-turn-helix domain-containing protein [Tomitella sp.]|nr:helix-turn-helix domain-containing protein [Tomitella sp.]
MGNERRAEDRFGRRVRTERELRGWTQADLAKHLEEEGVWLHPSAIAKIEHRDADRPRVIRLDEAESISRVFGLTIDEMYETEDHRVRYAGNRMRIWLERIVGECDEAHEIINYDVQALLAAADEADRGRLADILQAEGFDEFLRGVAGRAEELASKLRHPSRASAIDWQYPKAPSDDPSS